MKTLLLITAAALLSACTVNPPAQITKTVTAPANPATVKFYRTESQPCRVLMVATFAGTDDLLEVEVPEAVTCPGQSI